MSHMAGLLYVDASTTNGVSRIAVADAAGTLLAADTMLDPYGHTNLAELKAIRMAAKYATAGGGVVLTDSLTACRLIHETPEALHPRATHRRSHHAVADGVRRLLPDGWVVAWTPRKANLAHAALAEHAREEAADHDLPDQASQCQLRGVDHHAGRGGS